MQKRSIFSHYRGSVRLYQLNDASKPTMNTIPPQSNRVGDYVLAKRIASGGMGHIYVARRVSSDQGLVAVKVITDVHASDERYSQMLLTEAAAVTALVHPNIVKLLDFGDDNGRLYLVFEYISGQNLREILRRIVVSPDLPKPSFRVLCGLLADVAKSLAYMHGTGRKGSVMIHRDVTPGNIMITDDGAVKLIDLGVVRDDNSQTSPGLLKGKYAYMAPEYISGGNYDHRVDIWSLGVVLYEVFSQKRLFSGEHSGQILSQIVHDEIRPITEVADVPAKLATIIHRCLHKDPQERFDSALEVAAALAGVAAILPVDPLFPTMQSWMTVAFQESIVARNVLRDHIQKADLHAASTMTFGLEDSSDRSNSSSSSVRNLRNLRIAAQAKPTANSAADDEPLVEIFSGTLEPKSNVSSISIVSAAAMRMPRKTRWALAATGLTVLLAVVGVTWSLTRKSSTHQTVQLASTQPGCSFRTAGLAELDKGNCNAASFLFNQALGAQCPASDLVNLYKMAIDLCQAKNITATISQVPSDSANLIISSNPPGALILVDGARLTQPTPSKIAIALGFHNVRIENSAGEAHEKLVEVVAGHAVVVEHTFAGGPPPGPLERRSTPSKPSFKSPAAVPPKIEITTTQPAAVAASPIAAPVANKATPTVAAPVNKIDRDVFEKPADKRKLDSDVIVVPATTKPTIDRVNPWQK